MENFDYNQTNSDNQNPSEPIKNENNNIMNSSFYTENYKKPAKKRNNSLLQLIAVALISSILGGAIVASYLQFAVPMLQSSTQGYLSKLIPGNNAADNGGQSAEAKRVEIVTSTDSPVTAIAEKVSPSIVGIRTTFKAQGYFFGEQKGGGEGSGIIIRKDGYIMTNNHVVEGAVGKNGKIASGAKVEVILPNQKDKPYTAQIVGVDPKTDLAVIKIEATELPAVEFGDSDKVKIGELAVAIGNPAGLEYMGSITVGVISGLNRTIPLDDNKQMKLIQTDAAINPGNSGGALVNSKGQIIGINTAKLGGSGFEGLGFAIPVNKAKEITDSLIQFTYVKGRPLLGITADTRFNQDVAKTYNVPNGVLVGDVSPLSGAYKAGIQKGDIITKMDGKAIKDINELNEIKNNKKPGDTIAIEIYRDSEAKTLQVTLTEDKGN